MTLETRPGVTQKVLLLTPGAAPHGVLVMFPGGDGKGHFSERDGGVRLSRNFLLRAAPLFVGRGFVVAVVDAPSDQATGMSDRFRTRAAHTEDARKVVDRLGRQWPGPLVRVGTSRRTLSVAHLGVSLKEPRVAGLVFTASIGAPHRRFPLSLFDVLLEQITLPVLFVHHREDACEASRFEDAVRLRQRVTGSPRVDFVEVLGGDSRRPEPCQAMSPHGFLGREQDVVTVIGDWVLGKPVPSRVGQ